MQHTLRPESAGNVKAVVFGAQISKMYNRQQYVSIRHWKARHTMYVCNCTAQLHLVERPADYHGKVLHRCEMVLFTNHTK